MVEVTYVHTNIPPGSRLWVSSGVVDEPFLLCWSTWFHVLVSAEVLYPEGPALFSGFFDSRGPCCWTCGF